jgi:glutamine synthetase
VAEIAIGGITLVPGQTPEILIQHYCQRLYERFGFRAILAAELECYVTLKESDAQRFWDAVALDARHAQVPLMRIERERGENQYELVTLPMQEPQALAVALQSTKQLVLSQARAFGVEAKFDAKPYTDQPGSALHLHLHVEDAAGENPYTKTDEDISNPLAQSIAGLLHLTPYVVPLLYVDEHSFRRMQEVHHVPQTASWGVNNRTCAVRIPGSFMWEPKRIEWRVAGADAEHTQVIALMLAGVVAGMEQCLSLPPQTHGIAGKVKDAQWLPQNYADALEKMQTLPEIFAPLSAEIVREWLCLQ